MRKGWIAAAGIALAVVLFLGGCSGQPLTDREMGTGGGALLGAGTGAIIGAAVGHPAAGALIGGGLGRVGGYAVGNAMQNQQEFRTTRLKASCSSSRARSKPSAVRSRVCKVSRTRSDLRRIAASGGDAPERRRLRFLFHLADNLAFRLRGIALTMRSRLVRVGAPPLPVPRDSTGRGRGMAEFARAHPDALGARRIGEYDPFFAIGATHGRTVGRSRRSATANGHRPTCGPTRSPRSTSKPSSPQ